MKGPFDGREEPRETVGPPSGLEVYGQVKGLEVTFRKHSQARCQVERHELEK